MDLNDLRYPIGKYVVPTKITPQHHAKWKKVLTEFPQDLEALVSKLSQEQLDSPYRPEGWTVRQLVHHVADSHMNAYIRFKLGMTEEKPTIKPYEEARWAELSDSKLEVDISLKLISLLHRRWVVCLEDISNWKRAVFHPELKKEIKLDELLGMYAWHSNHHFAHIKGLVERKGW